MYTPDEGNLGGKVGFIFGGLSMGAFAVFFLEVPEMKNRTYTELDALFEAKTPTTDFNKAYL
jgi:SP family general alpha glucoside:H+ symporter-like MFS transporter